MIAEGVAIVTTVTMVTTARVTTRPGRVVWDVRIVMVIIIIILLLLVRHYLRSERELFLQERDSRVDEI